MTQLNKHIVTSQTNIMLLRTEIYYNILCKVLVNLTKVNGKNMIEKEETIKDNQ